MLKYDGRSAYPNIIYWSLNEREGVSFLITENWSEEKILKEFYMHL